MNWGSLFFSAEGRLGQKDFWLAAALLIVFGVLIHAVVVIGGLFWMLSAYCWICIYSKRLHDIGRSGWLQITPWVLGVVCIMCGGATIISSLLGAAFTGLPHFLGGLAIGGLTIGIGLFALSTLVQLLFLLWLGLTPGQLGPNRYGPEPGAAAAPAAI